jgi:preprotein translocase subunit YajC
MIEKFLKNQTPETIAILMWVLIAICVIGIGFIVWQNISTSLKIKKFRKSVKSGDEVRIASEYGAQGKIVEMNENEIYILVKVTNRNLIKKEHYLFPPRSDE